MKSKHLWGIVTFIACFAVSSFLAGLAGLAVAATDLSSDVPSPPHTFRYLTTQQKIQIFLENDRRTGEEMIDELVWIKRDQNEVRAEMLVTLRLVEKMRKADCAEMPKGFCLAWDEHLAAWTKLAGFLEQANREKKVTIDENMLEEFWQLNREIGRTYRELLGAAKRHGVDFR